MTLRPMTSTSKQSSQQNAAHGGQRQTPKASSSSGELRRHPSLVGAIDLHALPRKLGRSMSDLLTTFELRSRPRAGGRSHRRAQTPEPFSPASISASVLLALSLIHISEPTRRTP